MDRPALPIGHHAARRLDHRDRRGDVIALQSGLDHQVDLAGGDQRIGIAIHAIAGQPGPGCDAMERGPFRFGPDLGKSRENNGFGQVAGRARGHRAGAQRPGHLRPSEAAAIAMAGGEAMRTTAAIQGDARGDGGAGR